MYKRATITVYIYTVTIAYGNVYMILHNYTPTDVGVFLAKMCKIEKFLYFRRLSTT